MKINTNHNKLVETIEGINALMELHKKEQEQETSLRGDHEAGMFDKL